jgi:hypothetical protein
MLGAGSCRPGQSSGREAWLHWRTARGTWLRPAGAATGDRIRFGGKRAEGSAACAAKLGTLVVHWLIAYGAGLVRGHDHGARHLVRNNSAAQKAVQGLSGLQKRMTTSRDDQEILFIYQYKPWLPPPCRSEHSRCCAHVCPGNTSSQSARLPWLTKRCLGAGLKCQTCRGFFVGVDVVPCSGVVVQGSYTYIRRCEVLTCYWR